MTIDIFVSTETFGDASPDSRLVLRESGHVVEFNNKGRKLTPKEVAYEARDSKVLIAGTENLGPLVSGSMALKMIARVGVGLDGVPLELCQQKGIVVCWTPDAVTMAVAELTIGLMLATTRYVVQKDKEIRQGQWTREFGLRLEESVVGIVGFGRIGFEVARLLTSFKPKQLLVHDIQPKKHQIAYLKECGMNIREGSFDEVIGTSDILSLHVPLYRETKRMIDIEVLKTMPKGAFLLNTSRGGVIDENALYQSLTSGHLGGAALDVFEHEPYTGSLKNLNNLVLTPHLGSCSVDCRARMEKEAAEEAIRFLRDAPLVQEVPLEEYQYQVDQEVDSTDLAQ